MKLSAASTRSYTTFSNFEKLKLKVCLWTGDLFHPFCLLPASYPHLFHFKQVFSWTRHLGDQTVFWIQKGRRLLLKTTATRLEQNCWLLSWSLQCVYDASLLIADPARAGAPAHFAPAPSLRAAPGWAPPQSTERRGRKEPRTLLREMAGSLLRTNAPGTIFSYPRTS